MSCSTIVSAVFSQQVYFANGPTKGVSFAFFLEQPCHVAHALN
jgi:hypothetical protein